MVIYRIKCVLNIQILQMKKLFGAPRFKQQIQNARIGSVNGQLKTIRSDSLIKNKKSKRKQKKRLKIKTRQILKNRYRRKKKQAKAKIGKFNEIRSKRDRKIAEEQVFKKYRKEVEKQSILTFYTYKFILESLML